MYTRCSLIKLLAYVLEQLAISETTLSNLTEETVILLVSNMKDQKYRLVRDYYDHINQEKHWYFEEN